MHAGPILQWNVSRGLMALQLLLVRMWFDNHLEATERCDLYRGHFRGFNFCSKALIINMVSVSSISITTTISYLGDTQLATISVQKFSINHIPCKPHLWIPAHSLQPDHDGRSPWRLNSSCHWLLDVSSKAAGKPGQTDTSSCRERETSCYSW